jgi:hypothetical protein
MKTMAVAWRDRFIDPASDLLPEEGGFQRCQGCEPKAIVSSADPAPPG